MYKHVICMKIAVFVNVSLNFCMKSGSSISRYLYIIEVIVYFLMKMNWGAFKSHLWGHS